MSMAWTPDFKKLFDMAALLDAAFADDEPVRGIRGASRLVTARSVVKVVRSRLLMPIILASGIHSRTVSSSRSW